MIDMEEEILVVSKKIGMTSKEWNELAEYMENVTKKNTTNDGIGIGKILDEVLERVKKSDKKETFVLGYMFGALVGYHEGMSDGFFRGVSAALKASEEVLKEIAEIISKDEVEKILEKKFGNIIKNN